MLSPAIVFFSAALASASASASAPTLSNPFHDDGQANDRTPAADGDPANTLCRSRGKFLPAPVFALETCYLCYVYMPHTLFAGEGGADKWRGADGGVLLGHAVPALTDGQNMVGIWIANPRSIEGLFCLSPRGIIRSTPRSFNQSSRLKGRPATLGRRPSDRTATTLEKERLGNFFSQQRHFFHIRQLRTFLSKSAQRRQQLAASRPWKLSRQLPALEKRPTSTYGSPLRPP